MAEEKKPYRDLEITHRHGKTVIQNIPHKKAEKFIRGTKTNPAYETLRFRDIKEIKQLRPGTNETDCVPFTKNPEDK